MPDPMDIFHNLDHYTPWYCHQNMLRNYWIDPRRKILGQKSKHQLPHIFCVQIFLIWTKWWNSWWHLQFHNFCNVSILKNSHTLKWKFSRGLNREINEYKTTMKITMYTVLFVTSPSSITFFLAQGHSHNKTCDYLFYIINYCFVLLKLLILFIMTADRLSEGFFFNSEDGSIQLGSCRILF